MIWVTNPQPDGTREVVLGLKAAEIARLLAGDTAQVVLDGGALKIVIIASATHQDAIDKMVMDGLAGVESLPGAGCSAAPDPAARTS